MEERLAATREALRSPFPWIAASAMLALAASAWFALEAARLDHARKVFELRTEAAAIALRAQVERHPGAARMGAVTEALLEQGVLRFIDLRIYDQAEGNSGHALLLDTARGARATGTDTPFFERLMHFPTPGRAWSARFASRPEADAELRAGRPWIVAAGGALAAAAMFLLTTALVEALNRARTLSLRDPLTGLYNRRYHDETMPRELARARRAGQGVGVIAMDIDHFKRLNDTHGHDAGDQVLHRVGELLRGGTRAGDIACRFGGEEFTLILPGASLEAARRRAEALREAFSEMKFLHDGREIGPFTLSAGVACLSPALQDWPAALRSADRALYAAKQAGRNRVLTTADL